MRGTSVPGSVVLVEDLQKLRALEGMGAGSEPIPARRLRERADLLGCEIRMQAEVYADPKQTAHEHRVSSAKTNKSGCGGTLERGADFGDAEGCFDFSKRPVFGFRRLGAAHERDCTLPASLRHAALSDFLRVIFLERLGFRWLLGRIRCC